MIRVKKLDNGYVEVTADSGMVDIGCGAVEKIVCKPEEIEYIEEVRG